MGVGGHPGWEFGADVRGCLRFVGGKVEKNRSSFVCLKALKATELRLDRQMNRWQLNQRLSCSRRGLKISLPVISIFLVCSRLAPSSEAGSSRSPSDSLNCPFHVNLRRLRVSRKPKVEQSNRDNNLFNQTSDTNKCWRPQIQTTAALTQS